MGLSLPASLHAYDAGKILAVSGMSESLSSSSLQSVVLFDIDGTLIDTGGCGSMAFNKAGETAFGICNGTSDFVFAGATDYSLANQFLSRHGFDVSTENRNHFLDTYVFWLDFFLTHSPFPKRPFEDVTTVLDGLSSRPDHIGLGLVTGNTRLGAEIKLRHFGLWQYFSFGAFGCENPDRNCLAQYALQRIPAHIQPSPNNTWLVGDTFNDFNAAKSINARFIGFSSSHADPDRFHNCGADFSINSFSQFPIKEFSGYF